jgi:hypothetical protein
MKDQAAFLALMVDKYELESGKPLSIHDPIFFALNAVSHMGDLLSVYQDKGEREKYITTAQRRSSVLAHATGYGYVPRFLEPDRHTQRIAFAAALPEPVLIVQGQQVRTAIQDGSFTVAEVVDTVTADIGNEFIDVTVEVGATVQVVLGVSSNSVTTFPLEGDYVYIDSLVLYVTTGSSVSVWTRVTDDFISSDENSTTFTVDVGARSFNDLMKPNDLMLYISCGNGVNGRLFPDGATVSAVFKEVNPYDATLPLGVLTYWIDSIPYLDSTSNTMITKEKVLPESIEVLRRNAIYYKATSGGLSTEDDFERAAIIQAVDKIFKAKATADVVNGINEYVIHVSGDPYPLTTAYLDSIRDLMYANYSRSLNDHYTLLQAPANIATVFTLDVIFDDNLLLAQRNALVLLIQQEVIAYISELDLGQTYRIPDISKRLYALTDTTLLGLEYLAVTSLPPTLAANEELRITDIANVVVTQVEG